MFNKGCCNGPVIEQNGPIVEPVQTTYLEKDYYVNVPHIQPVHTHVVNKVHYNHEYIPQYSCSESTVESCGCKYNY